MSKLVNEVTLYFAKNYPYPEELSKTRMTKMVYLSDWEYSRKYGEQITDIDWYFDHYGPYVLDVIEEAQKDDRLKIEDTFSAYGNPKKLITFNRRKRNSNKYHLNKKQIEVLDSVIKETKLMNWNEFIDHVYNTPPIKKSNRYSSLKLNSFQ